MDNSEYINKLKSFNSTDKYFEELFLLFGLIQPYPRQKIIDYGCGIGTAVKYFRNITEKVFFMGYDVNNYMRETSPYSHHLCVDKIEPCNTIYFMHSFAHVPEISKVIFGLREHVLDKVVVITPNSEWLKLKQNENYVPDPTVVQHYSEDELREIFEDVGYKVTLCGQFGEKIGSQHERLFLVAKP